MDDITEYRRKHREAYLKRVASSSAGKSSDSTSDFESSQTSALDSALFQNSTFKGGSVSLDGSLRGTLPNPLSNTSADTLFNSSTKSNLLAGAIEETPPDSDYGNGESTSCKRPTAPYNYERDLYEQQLSDKTKRDRYRSPRMDEDYESSLELARKLQKEFDAMDQVRKPDLSYKECLLSSDNGESLHENPDVDLQKAIAKSLIDM